MNNPAEYSESELFRTDNGVTEMHRNIFQVDSKVEKIDFILVYKETYNENHIQKRTIYERNLTSKRGLKLEHVPSQDKVCVMLPLFSETFYLMYYVPHSWLSGFTQQAIAILIGDPRYLRFNVLFRENAKGIPSVSSFANEFE